MNKAILMRLSSPTEATIFCAEQGADGKTVEKGKFTIEINDSTAILVIQRLWLAGTPVEAIASAMALGLLPPKSK